MKIISWNVNGIRAIYKKGFLDWLKAESPDILCLQETKTQPNQLNDTHLRPLGYTSYWASATRKGYSGVATFVKKEPQSVEIGINRPIFDAEGRTLSVTYPNFTLFNIYVPSGSRDRSRVEFKLAYFAAIWQHCYRLRAAGQELIICGDLNVAHQAIDLANPNSNQKTSGFLPIERAWLDRFIDHGYRDLFRQFNQEADQYTWWTYRAGARVRNIGWRLDYFLGTTGVSAANCYLLPEVMGSDHCPIVLILS